MRVEVNTLFYYVVEFLGECLMYRLDHVAVLQLAVAVLLNLSKSFNNVVVGDFLYIFHINNYLVERGEYLFRGHRDFSSGHRILF